MDKNLLLQDDPFAPAAPDSMEHLPSHHCAVDVPDIKPQLRMSAYYYGFCTTGVYAVDRILSAVACAGKAFHHTDSWTESASPREGTAGESPVDWIQNAAADAAKIIESLERRIAEASKGHAMYEHVRTMSARAFTDLWCASISGGSTFDDLILADMNKRKEDRV